LREYQLSIVFALQTEYRHLAHFPLSAAYSSAGLGLCWNSDHKHSFKKQTADEIKLAISENEKERKKENRCGKQTRLQRAFLVGPPIQPVIRRRHLVHEPRFARSFRQLANKN